MVTPESVGGRGSVGATKEGSLLVPTIPVRRGLDAEIEFGAVEFCTGVSDVCDDAG